MANLTPQQVELAAQEVAHAATRGDKKTVAEVRAIATDSSVASRADFNSQVLVEERKQRS